MTAADLDPEFVLVQTLTKGQAFVSYAYIVERKHTLQISYLSQISTFRQLLLQISHFSSSLL